MEFLSLKTGLIWYSLLFYFIKMKILY